MSTKKTYATQQSRLMYDSRVYTANLRDYSMVIDKNGLALLITPAFHVREKFLLAAGVLAPPFLALICLSLLSISFQVVIAVTIAMWIIVGGLTLSRIVEIIRLKRMPREILFAIRDCHCFLYDRSIEIPVDADIAIQYVGDYRPSYYSDVRGEGDYNLYYEVNLVVSVNNETYTYGLIGDRTTLVCSPIANQLSEQLRWPIRRE